MIKFCIQCILLCWGFGGDLIAQSLRFVPSESSPSQIDIHWKDDGQSKILQHSGNMKDWALVDASGYMQAGGNFSATLTTDATSCFYRLKNVGSPNIYVIGDSISDRGMWTDNLYRLTGRQIFSQAIGGSKSPEMVSRTQGLELVYPRAGEHELQVGDVSVLLRRPATIRSQLEAYESYWGLYTKVVSNPYQVEVYNNGKFLGFARRDTKVVSSDYQATPYTLYSDSHGLEEGDPVVFIADNSAHCSQMSIADSIYQWNSSSSKLPNALVEYRVYYVTNVKEDTFEVKKFATSQISLDLESEMAEGVSIELGWRFDFRYEGGEWDLEWKPRTDFDDWIWVLEVSANDIPNNNASLVTIPNTHTLLGQMIERNKRFIILCPPSGHHSWRGPGSFNWKNYYEVYMPYVIEYFPDHHIDTMTLLDGYRTEAETFFLEDPEVPELLWIGGVPTNASTWILSRTKLDNTAQMWVGPGFIPLQFRKNFTDPVHLNEDANELLAQELSRFLTRKGW